MKKSREGVGTRNNSENSHWLKDVGKKSLVLSTTSFLCVLKNVELDSIDKMECVVFYG